MRNTSTDSKRAIFVILKNHASAPFRKERLSLTSKARRKASRNKFVEKSRMPDIVENFEELDHSKNKPFHRWHGHVFRSNSGDVFERVLDFEVAGGKER